MKTVFIITLLTLVATTTLAYTENSEILNAEYIQTLPVLRETSVESDSGPSMAAVQPTAHINFTYYSCSALRHSVEVHEVNNLLFVAVQVVPGQMTCMGPSRPHQLRLQISSDFRHNVVILNPVNGRFSF